MRIAETGAVALWTEDVVRAGGYAARWWWQEDIQPAHAWGPQSLGRGRAMRLEASAGGGRAIFDGLAVGFDGGASVR